MKSVHKSQQINVQILRDGSDCCRVLGVLTVCIDFALAAVYHSAAVSAKSNELYTRVS